MVQYTIDSITIEKDNNGKKTTIVEIANGPTLFFRTRKDKKTGSWMFHEENWNVVSHDLIVAIHRAMEYEFSFMMHNAKENFENQIVDEIAI